jgi:phosphoribosylanthranilate isomerase
MDLVMKDPSKRQVPKEDAEFLASQLGPECAVFETSSLSGLYENFTEYSKKIPGT